MAIKDTCKTMRELLDMIQKDMDKAEAGNKAAAQRVRTNSIKLEKVAKVYRKESVKETRSGVKRTGAAKGKTRKPAAKKPAAKKAASAKRKPAPKKTTAAKPATKARKSGGRKRSTAKLLKKPSRKKK
ncbi:MAG: histone [Chlamydiales bacterium]